MSLVKLYYLQKISILIFFILNFINGEKVEDRILSPYNSIPGYELEDWSKSPDFGILNIISNLPIDSIEFDRIEPSEKIDNFIWTSPKVALPYGSYEVKYNPQKRFYDRIDTLIVVERQKTKKIDFLKEGRNNPKKRASAHAPASTSGAGGGKGAGLYALVCSTF